MAGFLFIKIILPTISKAHKYHCQLINFNKYIINSPRTNITKELIDLVNLGSFLISGIKSEAEMYINPPAA
ncbi:hypothetical protein KKG58_02525, partial [Patescibacteria group bacterium]|nr:hypothetical protein [Patescibacteria group bacterium]